MRFWVSTILIGFLTAISSHAQGPKHPAECSELITHILRKMDDAPLGPVKYLTTEGEVPALSRIEAYHLQMMLGEIGNKVDLGLYRDARSILLLGDGSKSQVTDRLGPLLAREFPKKWVVSADLEVGENLLIRNWSTIQINHVERFPVNDNSFDRIILRKGLCQCHSSSCCAGFSPHGPQAKQFFREVIRTLDKRNPNAFAVLHGIDNVGGIDVQAWSSMLDEIALTEPIQYQVILDKGFFHSILIRTIEKK